MFDIVESFGNIRGSRGLSGFLDAMRVSWTVTVCLVRLVERARSAEKRIPCRGGVYGFRDNCLYTIRVRRSMDTANGGQGSAVWSIYREKYGVDWMA